MDGVENLAGWLTTIVARVCLDMLRARKSRREAPLDERLPDPIVTRDEGADPEHEALQASSVSLALLVVLETLSPAERLAFVLHDIFAVPFDEIAAIAGRSPAAARQLASRARRRIQDAGPTTPADPARQRAVVSAFLAASRSGDFEALVAMLDPDVVLRAHLGATAPGGVQSVHGAHSVASQALSFRRLARVARPALVNGVLGLVTVEDGRAVSVMSFTVSGGRIVDINVLADPERLARLDLAGLWSDADP